MAASRTPAKAGNGEALSGEVIPPDLKGKTAQDHQQRENMRLWDVLGRTDPKHTKPFTRSGGFRGTAIKPIYAEEKMTRLFGPCGQGWGTTPPQFDVQGTLVFCTIAVWYVDPDTGERSEPCWGVGGDSLEAKRNGVSVPDDEAFKKALTDAIGNAMKRIGMSADVHMGQFEDSKYVEDATADAEAEARQRAYAEDKAMMQKIIDDASACATNAEIDAVMRGASHKIKALQEGNPGLVTRLKGEIAKLRQSLPDYQPKETTT